MAYSVLSLDAGAVLKNLPEGYTLETPLAHIKTGKFSDGLESLQVLQTLSGSLMLGNPKTDQPQEIRELHYASYLMQAGRYSDALLSLTKLQKELVKMDGHQPPESFIEGLHLLMGIANTGLSATYGLRHNAFSETSKATGEPDLDNNQSASIDHLRIAEQEFALLKGLLSKN